MRRVAFVFACSLLSCPALGAEGDLLIVTGDRVNVRSGPALDHVVVKNVSRNQRVVEVGRQGDWVQVKIAGSGAGGWIQGSLVAPAEGEAAEEVTTPPLPAAGPMTGAGGLGDVAAGPEPLEAAVAPRETGALAPGTGEIKAVDMQRFQDSVDYLNSRSQSLGGVDLFGAVQPLANGTVQVGATDAWAGIPPAAQRSYANVLLERWAAATGRAGQVKVQIVDESGQLLMEESKP
jgi:hypothetical protein